MSQYSSSFDQPQQDSGPGLGLPITALVLAILGMCLPGLGLIALIIGAIALVRGGRAGRGFGLSLAAVIVGAVSLITGLLLIGIMIPALGKARQTARQLKSMSQLQRIDQALLRYANDNKGWFPEAGADWQARIAQYNINPGDFISPRSETATAADSYTYVAGYRVDSPTPGVTIIVYENSSHVPHGFLAVGHADGQVEVIDVKDLQHHLDNSPKPELPGTPPSKPNR